jgi:hypothetical protein
MKNIKLTLTALLVLLNFSLAAIADDVLPGSGTYFILNRSSGEALQPVAASVAQNVLMSPFDKSGSQKWTITRFLDPVTKKPTNRYNIRLAGEFQGLELQPHPSVSDHTALISIDKSVFVMQPKGDGLLLKSVAKNGDAMCIYPVPNDRAEVRFGACDDSDKYVWVLQPCE